jgi:hypothetical protein
LGETAYEIGLNKIQSEALIRNPNIANWIKGLPEAKATNPLFQDFINGTKQAVVVKSAKELAQLPIGTPYQDQNGNHGIKLKD